MRSKRSRNSGLEWRRPPPFFLCISKVILIRADPLQVPISHAFMNLKPLVVCIHDNLFLYTRHITQVCFPSIQRVGCRQWQWWYHSGSWAAAQWVECALSSYFTPKCELMYAALHIKTESFFSCTSSISPGRLNHFFFSLLFYWWDTNTLVQQTVRK